MLRVAVRSNLRLYQRLTRCTELARFAHVACNGRVGLGHVGAEFRLISRNLSAVYGQVARLLLYKADFD